MTVLQNNRMRAFVMCATLQKRSSSSSLTARRAECIAAASDVEFSQMRRAVVTDTFTCSQNNQVLLYVQACKCQHDTKASCKMYKWQVPYRVKTKAVPGLCFRTWYAKKQKMKKRIKKTVWVCIFTRDFLSLCVQKHKRTCACTMVYHHLRCQ